MVTDESGYWVIRGLLYTSFLDALENLFKKTKNIIIESRKKKTNTTSNFKNPPCIHLNSATKVWQAAVLTAMAQDGNITRLKYKWPGL